MSRLCIVLGIPRNVCTERQLCVFYTININAILAVHDLLWNHISQGQRSMLELQIECVKGTINNERSLPGRIMVCGIVPVNRFSSLGCRNARQSARWSSSCYSMTDITDLRNKLL